MLLSPIHLCRGLTSLFPCMPPAISKSLHSCHWISFPWGLAATPVRARSASRPPLLKGASLWVIKRQLDKQHSECCLADDLRIQWTREIVTWYCILWDARVHELNKIILFTVLSFWPAIIEYNLNASQICLSVNLNVTQIKVISSMYFYIFKIVLYFLICISIYFNCFWICLEARQLFPLPTFCTKYCPSSFYHWMDSTLI